MKPEDGADLIQGKIITGAAAATSWLSVIGTLLEIIPMLIGVVVAFLSAILLITQIKKRSLEGELLSLKLKKKKREDAEEEEKREVQRRIALGLECKRCTDEKYADQIEGG